MAKILKHAHSEELEAENLVTDDGRPNIDRIKAYYLFMYLSSFLHSHILSNAVSLSNQSLSPKSVQAVRHRRKQLLIAVRAGTVDPYYSQDWEFSTAESSRNGEEIHQGFRYGW